MPNLDLNLQENIWLENYIAACHIYWADDADCSMAKGRLNILKEMTKMNIGDVILIPRTPDHERFMIVTVKGKYYFDNEPHENFQNDFRHAITVKDQKTFPYSTETLEADIFGAPFLHAIDPVVPSCGAYKKMVNFIEDNYR